MLTLCRERLAARRARQNQQRRELAEKRLRELTEHREKNLLIDARQFYARHLKICHEDPGYGCVERIEDGTEIALSNYFNDETKTWETRVRATNTMIRKAVELVYSHRNVCFAVRWHHLRTF